MIDKLLDRVSQAGTMRTIYQLVASMCALVTISAWVSKILTWCGHKSSNDSQLAALGHTPLAIIYWMLRLFGVHHTWVSTVNTYLHANPARPAIFAAIASGLALVATLRLSPPATGPSLQASTWWVCAMVTTQCSAMNLAIMLVAVVGWIIYRKVRSIKTRRATYDVGHLILAALAFLLPLGLLMNDGYTRE